MKWVLNDQINKSHISFLIIKRKYTYYEGGCLSAILFHVLYTLSLVITLLIGLTNVFGARFYQIDLESYVQVTQLGM